MQSAIDISQDNFKLLSTLDLDEVIEIVADIVTRVADPGACAIAVWDMDLESFADCPIFGPQKKNFKNFVDAFVNDGSPVLSAKELDPDEYEIELGKDLQPVVCYPIKDEDQLNACILLGGGQKLEIDALESALSQHPLALSLSRAWEYRELKRENERLRGQYEQLDDSIRSMEEQTRKIIHDMMTKDALHTRKMRLDRLVYSISNTVRSSVKIQEVLHSAVNEMGREFGVTHCLLLRPVSTQEELIAFEYHNPLQAPIKDLFYTDAGHEFMRTAMSHEAPQVLTDPKTDPQNNYNRDFLGKLGLLSGLIVPLILREHVLGVIFLQECVDSKDWSIDETALLGSLADQLSVAIENADLHEERELQAVTDGLTGIANRRHFNEMFQREFERARRYEQPLSLVVADLDFLKKINDTYGHQAGDEAIKAVARVMQQSSRSIDLAARYGGEEYCLLLPNTDLEMANQIAQRLRGLINDIELDGPGRISASIGVASFPIHAGESEALFQKADEALYEAKQTGRNRVCIAGGNQTKD